MIASGECNSGSPIAFLFQSDRFVFKAHACITFIQQYLIIKIVNNIYANDFMFLIH